MTEYKKSCILFIPGAGRDKIIDNGGGVHTVIKKQIYNLEFTEEELQMIYMVFSKLENKCFAKWRSMWPDDGERASAECTKQWLMRGKVESIKDRVAKPLGLSVRKEL